MTVVSFPICSECVPHCRIWYQNLMNLFDYDKDFDLCEGQVLEDVCNSRPNLFFER